MSEYQFTEVEYLSRKSAKWTSVERLVLVTSISNTYMRDIARALERTQTECWKECRRLGISAHFNPRLRELRERWAGRENGGR